MAMPFKSVDFFGSAHFWCATLLRLGAVKPPERARCKLTARAQKSEEGDTAEDQQGRVCGHAMGARASHHAMLCKMGPARMRPHRHLAATLTRELLAAQVEVDVERVAPELMDTRPNKPDDKRDAVLDLVVTFPGSFAQSWVDVSIRCPHAERYAQASSVPGEAAAKAAEEKHDRYGPFVLPLAFESYGRLGTAGRCTLEALAVHAGACAKDRWAVQRLVPRWLASLERAVIFSIAEIVLLALGARAMDVFGG